MEKRNCGRKELELYFHIPFCVRKCLYCDFLSAPGDEDTKDRYMKALLTETVGSALRYGDYQVTSIFIGGGTPSVVRAAHISELMDAVRAHYDLAEDAEVTMEVNPGTVSGKALRRFRKAGINRLSIGLQSADDRELAGIGRIHTWRQFLEAFRAARQAGFANLNVDIMSALPGQTLSGYRHTLEKVLALEEPPEHISAYSLILEEGTPLYDRFEKGELELPDEDTDRVMYQETKRILAQAGYERYEISNYAKKGYECRHNCGYWRRKNYAGFGIGAASLVENVRFRNSADLQAYLKNPLGCREDVQALGRQEQMEEFMFLGLRMTEGVDCGEFRRLFGCGMEEAYGEVVRKNVEDGLLRYLPGDREEGGGAPPMPSVGSNAPEDRNVQPVGSSVSEDKNMLSVGSGVPENINMPSVGSNAPEDINMLSVGSGVPENRNMLSAGPSVPADNMRLVLTDRGLDLSNYVMAQFLK